jgi:hypothetical protein
VLVVDGSPPEVFRQHARHFEGRSRHLPVDRHFGYRNDKVNGIHTGVEQASTEKIILTDDDIRYTVAQINALVRLLDEVEVVRPQNYLAPLSFVGKMEAARMLINRATLATGDYPGTCAFRRESFQAAGHYDGDVLFDNEELIRHFAREGAQMCYALDFFVRKRPPAFRKWLEQRPRQAYEDFPLRAKSALFFSLAPTVLIAFLLGGRKAGAIVLASLGLAASGLAAAGRARGEASKYFPVSICLFAPLWMIERSLSSWWALFWFLRRGGYPFGETILARGVGRDWFAGGRIAAEQLKR